MPIPHELNPSLSREAIDDPQLAIVVIKPHVSDEDVEIIADGIKAMAEHCDLEVSSPSTTILDEDAVIALYPRIFEDWGSESIDPEQLQYCQELIDYMTSGELTVYVLHGAHAADKALELKTQIRNKLGDCETRRLRNFVHVPDEHEVDLSFDVLLGVEIE